MSGEDAAAWAQAYLSAAAILVSGALAVFVPWNERRLATKRSDLARLDLHCSRTVSGGLLLMIHYTPEFQNHSLGASVQLIDNPTARVYKGIITQFRSGINIVENSINVENINGNRRYNAVSLFADEIDPKTRKGAIFIENLNGVGTIDEAIIKVCILRHRNWMVISQKIRVSPSDIRNYENGPPVAVITGASGR